MKKKPYYFLIVILCLILAVTTYLTAESLGLDIRGTHINNKDNYQQLVHGVGLGATTKPTWCYINFDPRVDPRCPCMEWPIAGGYCYCPDHTGSVSYMANVVDMGVSIEIIRN